MLALPPASPALAVVPLALPLTGAVMVEVPSGLGAAWLLQQLSITQPVVAIKRMVRYQRMG
jgi:hypothetical protein